MEDSKIIELYRQRNENAIMETRKKYGAYCLAVAKNVLHNQEDAEECVSDTYLKAWNTIPPQKPENLQMFLAKITRNQAINRFYANSAEKRGGGELALVLDELSECLASPSDVAEQYEGKELAQYVRKFVRMLPQREGNVFVRRYFFTESITQIARKYGLTENNVAVILSRTRKKLKDYLLKEGFWNE